MVVAGEVDGDGDDDCAVALSGVLVHESPG